MIYETFVLTLLARMGLSLAKPDAGAVREEVDRLVRLSAMVDDLLAEAGYDTLFDTREKCLEALRQDIKAKLGTATVDREVLRLSTELADAWQKNWLLRDTIETQKKMRLDLAAEQDKLVAALDEAQNQLAESERLRREWYDSNMALRSHLQVAEASLAAERKKWPELRAELATACAERAKEVVHNRELNAQVERTRALVRARGLTITLFEKIVLGHADPGAVLRDAETGETAHIAPDVRAALCKLIDRARSSERLREANRELADALVARKPLDRDRIRLALLDFDPKVNTVGFINDLADHLVKRLA